MNEWLKFKKNNSIAILSLNRPDIRNPLGEPGMQKILKKLVK